MENQHRMIKTYRELSATEIALMNACKEMEARVEDLLSRVRVHIIAQSTDAQNALADPDLPAADAAAAQEVLNRHTDTEPLRWLELSRTNMQVGFMELCRAIAQPQPIRAVNFNESKEQE